MLGIFPSGVEHLYLDIFFSALEAKRVKNNEHDATSLMENTTASCWFWFHCVPALPATLRATRALQDLDNIVDRARHNRQLLKAVDSDEHIVLDAHTAKAAEATQHGSVDEASLRGVGQRSVEQLQNER